MIRKLLPLLLLLTAPLMAQNNNYQTTFPLVENPASENSRWIQGGVTGLDWGNVQTCTNCSGGTGVIQHASGTIINGGPPFSDSTAVLSGTWHTAQMASAVVAIANQQNAHQEEVELRLNTTITAHSITGYEFDFSVDSSGGVGTTTYFVIVKWNGAIGSFCYLHPSSSGASVCDSTVTSAWFSGQQLNNGDVITATNDGAGTLRLYVNGIQKIQAIDTAFTGGKPGVGFWNNGGVVSEFANYGLSSFTALDTAGTLRTAATCNQPDVNTQTSAAVDGDIVFIPAGTCTWTSGISVSSKGITVIGSGGSGNAITQITDQLSSGSLFNMTPAASSSITRISSIKPVPFLPRSGYGAPISVIGTCISTGCPNLRLDHIVATSAWGGIGISDDTFAIVANVFGVADHNTIGDVAPVSGNGVNFINVSHGGWQGTGVEGDNSWANASTFGTNQAFYIEDNVFSFVLVTDTDFTGSAGGGGRFVCRFNTVNNISSGGVCSTHGTDTGGRIRGGRQWEGYYNTGTCTNTKGCGSAWPSRSSTGRSFGNTFSNSGGGFMTRLSNNDAQRRWRVSGTFGPCDGSSPWDTNDGVVYYSGTIGTVTLNSGGASFTIADTSNPGGFNPPSGAPYSFHDVNLSAGAEITSSSAGSFIISVPDSVHGTHPVAGDSYQVLRATACLDQSFRGGGNLVQDQSAVISTWSVSGSTVTINATAALPSGYINNAIASIVPAGGGSCSVAAAIRNVTSTSFQYTAPGGCSGSGSGGSTTTPVLVSTGKAGAVSEALDPVYEAADSLPTSATNTIGSSSLSMIANRDFYVETVNQAVNSCSGGPGVNCTPFTGNTGAGHGPFASMPNTCTPKVGYWATDKGTWNTSVGASAGKQGALYICTSANTWTLSYTPFGYPHSLINTASSSGTGSISLTPSSQDFGSVNVGSSSSSITFTVSNSTAVTATGISPTTTGGNPGDFTITNSGAGSCAVGVGGANSITGGNSCTFTVVFSPTAAGSRSTTLSVTYSGGDSASPKNSSLTGTGASSTPSFTLTPTTFNFLSVAIGANSSAHTFTLTNTGSATATISSIAFNDTNAADFSETTTCGSTLASSANCTISVTFSPISGAVGLRTATLTVTDTPDNIAISSSLSGLATSCANIHIGSFTLCGAVYNDVNNGTASTVTYYPTPGNGVLIHVTYCGVNGCATTATQTVINISDNINSPETCFTASPHSPFDGDSNPSGTHDWQRFYEYYCPSIPNGVTGFTVNITTPNGWAVQNSMSEWKAGSIAATNFWENVDTIATSTSSGTTASVSTNGATSNASDLIWAVINNSGADTAASPGSGYTCVVCNPLPTPGFMAEAKAVPVTGMYTATTTWLTNNRNWFGVIAPLKTGNTLAPPTNLRIITVSEDFWLLLTKGTWPSGF